MSVCGFTAGRRSGFEKLIQVKFNQNMTYNDHISSVSEKASSKICTSARVTLYMQNSKKRMLM